MNFKIKICGITNTLDALAAVDAGADAIGLNFYGGSKRCVRPADAREIVDAINGRAEMVGVFVNASPHEIHAVCKSAALYVVQLHGNEPPELLNSLNKNFEIIRARRLDERGTRAIADDINACCEATGDAPGAVLVDAATAGQFGGSGHTVDWQQLKNHREWMFDVPLILAGGLTPENVTEAIRIVQPQAVDVASGVESSPSKKDLNKMRDFVNAAQTAFQAI